jgi:alginate O-acetyltransferase complex protein AlgI
MRWDSEKFSVGLERILYGYVKITFLANYLVSNRLAQYVADLGHDKVSLAAYLTMLQQGLNGYLQFAGYSDIAIGCGLLLGYRVMENSAGAAEEHLGFLEGLAHIAVELVPRIRLHARGVLHARPALAVLATMLVIGLCTKHLSAMSFGAPTTALYRRLAAVPEAGLGCRNGHFLQSRGFRLTAHALAVLVTFHFVMFGFRARAAATIAAAIDFYRTILLGM